MPEDLRRQLGQSQVQGQQERRDFPWEPGVWEAAMRAFASGWTMPERHYPVIIDPEGLVSSPEKLQELAKLDSVPESWATSRVYRRRSGGGDHDRTPTTLRICDLSRTELHRLMEVAECETQKIVVMFHETERYTFEALRLKTDEERAPQEATGDLCNGTS